LSFLKLAGDGIAIEMFYEGQTNNDDEMELQKNIDGEVYIYRASGDTMHLVI
jgi:hypothetical protein